MPPAPTAVLLAIAISLTAGAGRQGTDDPQLRTAVERFFAAQEAEDIAAYLSLWSATAQRPQPEQLRYVFDGGDDKYSDVTILRVVPDGDRVRVRVSATRDRTLPPRVPGGQPFTQHSTMTWALVYVREGTDWKLVREGSAVDALAEALVQARTEEEREQMLRDDAGLVTDGLLLALSRFGGQAAA